MMLSKLQIIFNKLKQTGLCKATALMAIDPGLEFGREFQTKSETIKSNQFQTIRISKFILKFQIWSLGVQIRFETGLIVKSLLTSTHEI